MLGKLFLSICITKNKMNKLNLFLVWLFVLFINEYEFIHKISLLLMVILGSLYYWKYRSKKIEREEKHLILLFLIYFFLSGRWSLGGCPHTLFRRFTKLNVRYFLNFWILLSKTLITR